MKKLDKAQQGQVVGGDGGDGGSTDMPRGGTLA